MIPWVRISPAPLSGHKSCVRPSLATPINQILLNDLHLPEDIADYIICLVFSDEWLELSVSPEPDSYDGEIVKWLNYWLTHPRERLANPFVDDHVSLNTAIVPYRVNVADVTLDPLIPIFVSIYVNTFVGIQLPENISPKPTICIVGDNYSLAGFKWEDQYLLYPNTWYHPKGAIPCVNIGGLTCLKISNINESMIIEVLAMMTPVSKIRFKTGSDLEYMGFVNGPGGYITLC